MITAGFYVFFFFILLTLLLLAPLSIFLIFNFGWIIVLVIISCYIGLILFTRKSTSSSRLTFFDGMAKIAQSNMSGCANITMLYIFPVLFLAFLTALYHSLIGIKEGKGYVEKEWLRIVREYELTSNFRI